MFHQFRLRETTLAAQAESLRDEVKKRERELQDEARRPATCTFQVSFALGSVSEGFGWTNISAFCLSGLWGPPI